MLKLTEIIEKEINTIFNTYSIPKEKILWATSICSDELNHNQELYNLCGACFQLGGLAGYPHSGVTGFTAYFDHIPDNGAAVIIYGPHIGKCCNEKDGYVIRPYQKLPTPTCGALWGVLNERNSENPNNFAFDENNLQFQLLSQIIRKNSTTEDYATIAKLTQKMYDIIHEKIHIIIHQSMQKKHDFPVFYVGGIIINTPNTNFFDVKHQGKILINKKKFCDD